MQKAVQAGPKWHTSRQSLRSPKVFLSSNDRLGEAGLEPARREPANTRVFQAPDGGGGAESDAVAEGGAATSLSPAFTLMLGEFQAAPPAGRIRLAIVWGILPGSPAAAALGVPRTDADDTDGTARNEADTAVEDARRQVVSVDSRSGSPPTGTAD